MLYFFQRTSQKVGLLDPKDGIWSYEICLWLGKLYEGKELEFKDQSVLEATRGLRIV